MQFHLEKDELKLLADVLLEDPQRNDELLSKVMAHDLRFDGGELETTGEILTAKKERLKDEISREASPAGKAQLEQRLALLGRVLERVNEACVMF